MSLIQAPMDQNNLPRRFLNEHFILTRPNCEFIIIVNANGARFCCDGTLVVTTQRLILCNDTPTQRWTAVSLPFDLMQSEGF